MSEQHDRARKAMAELCDAYGIDDYGAQMALLDAAWGFGIFCGARTPQVGDKSRQSGHESHDPGKYPPQFYKALRYLRSIYHTPPRASGADPTGLAVEVQERMEAHQMNAAPTHVPGRPSKCSPEIVAWAAQHKAEYPTMNVTARVSAIAAHFEVSDRRVWEWRARGLRNGGGMEGELVRAMQDDPARV